MEMIVVLARLQTKSGSEAEFVEVAKQLVEQSNTEPGCQHYELLQEGSGRYSFLERYVNEQAVEAHRKSDHYRTLGKQMSAFMDGKPEVIRLQTID
ncbi:hypothetical protein P368_10740 [Comamonas thiooxydans]|nr:hypothetical protein P369_09480 [Comamonas thiooxydans]KGG98564.1 hypothetical protein P367_12385 [Comamonas thiooxydans]KGH04514.1 hypothetical protein P365_12555 [Comamonas thiooxydans]KGH13024.1 hypothetical protein P368_10740 [Comamonas thiooxydans]TZG06894.1 antibiotic biosynthesis monooxygenase [Comamonas thiooxydans]